MLEARTHFIFLSYGSVAWLVTQGHTPKDSCWNLLLFQENPARANGHIFNVGNPHNEVTVRELAELMTDVSDINLTLNHFFCFLLGFTCFLILFIEPRVHLS